MMWGIIGVNERDRELFKAELRIIVEWEEKESAKLIESEKAKGNFKSGLDAYQIELQPVIKEANRRTKLLCQKYGLE